MPLCIISASGKVICYESPPYSLVNGTWQDLNGHVPPTLDDRVLDLMHRAEVSEEIAFAISHIPKGRKSLSKRMSGRKRAP